MNVYRSEQEAYPFLADEADDLRCDFEILTDKISSLTGLLKALCSETWLLDELDKVNALVYHLNPSLRTFTSITKEEFIWLLERTDAHKKEVSDHIRTFVLPQGSERACLAHVLRTECKTLVRLIYRYLYCDNHVDTLVIDFSNGLSNYFFVLAVRLNALDNIMEKPFVSRNYK